MKFNENPDKKPLSELYITSEDGKYKALHEKWIQNREFSEIPSLALKDGKLIGMNFKNY
jgi:hypothetical protein